MRPGPNVVNSTATPPSTSQVNTGTWFTVGAAQQGPTTPVLLTSFAQYQKVFGPRGTYSATFSDAIEQYFNEGGARCYVCRVVGPAAVAASIKLKDAGAIASCLVTALGAGTWANGFKIVVTGVAGAYTIAVQNAAGEALEVSPNLTSNADAVAWGKTSVYVTVTSEGANSPAAGTFVLAAGTDDTSNIVTATYEAGARKFGPEYGPGQLSVPGVGTLAVIEAIYRIAAEQQRRGIADGPNKATKTELIALNTAIRALGAAARSSYLAGDWQQGPTIPGAIAPRAIPMSAYVAAKCAYVDSLGNPNQAPAGKWGILFASLGKEANFTEAEVEELYAAGVNVCKVVNGQVRIYGSRTGVNPQTDPLYLQFNNVRLDMAIIWKGLAIEESMMFSQIDGENNDASLYANLLTGMLLPLFKVGALFGKTPAEAFSVDASADVNTLATEEEGNLNATIAARRSKGAEQVNLNVARVAITQEV